MSHQLLLCFCGCGWNEIIMPGEAPKLTQIASIFNGCKTKRINISGISGENITNAYGFFYTEAQIEYIDIRSFDFSSITNDQLFVRNASFSPNVIIYVKDNSAKQFIKDRRSSLTDANFVVVNEDSTESP